MIRKGELILPQLTMEETLKNFDSESIFIKGANAVDPEGNAGIFVAHPSGGTMGYAYSILTARGCRIITPVGLEKLIPSCEKSSTALRPGYPLLLPGDPNRNDSNDERKGHHGVGELPNPFGPRRFILEAAG